MSSELVVLEAGDLQQLSFLHQGTTRLRVTCFDLCPSVILLGANSGTIYVLDHETFKLKTQIPTGSGSVVQLSVSSDESLVACALSDGTVKVFELDEWSGGGLGRALVVSREHEGNVVSALAWEHTNAEVYIADSTGRVSVLYVIRSKTASLFRSQSIHLMTLESGVIQLDYSDGYLLVSTLTRSYICNTALETFAQVGTRLRQGEYGGCFCRVSSGAGTGHGIDGSSLAKLTQQEFYESLEGTITFEQSLSDRQGLSDCYEATEEMKTNQTNRSSRSGPVAPEEQSSRIFCARPGTRIWESDHSGKVLVTHQLKNALKVPAANVLHTDGSFGEEELLEEIGRWPEDIPMETSQEHRSNGEPGSEDGDGTGMSTSEQRGTTAPLHPPVSVAFTKLLSYYNNYLLAISSYGLYVIDPSNSKVLMWINVSDSVTDIKVSGNSLIYKTGSGCIKNFMITTVDVAILFLHTQNLPVECAYLCLQSKGLFSSSELLCRLGAKILTDLSHSIKNDIIKERLIKIRVSANLVKIKGKSKTKMPLKAGVTCIRNDNYEKEELKKCLNLALKTQQSSVPVSRWYSEPQLRGVVNKAPVLQRGVTSVKTSPVHQRHRDLRGSSTSTFLYQGSSISSLTQFSSEDTLQSEKSVSGIQSASPYLEKKAFSTDAEHNKRQEKLLSSRGCSQESSSKSSHKSFDSSPELYEDPLFPSDDSFSSPDPDVMSRALYNNQSVNPYGVHNFYNLAYTPIHPGSEAATLLQEMVENVTTNMVGTITSGTRSLTEKLRNVTPLMSEEKFKKCPDGSLSVTDDQRVNTGSPDTDGTDDLEHLVVCSKMKKKYRLGSSGTTPLPSKSSTPLVDEALRRNQELPGVVRNLHELVTSTTEKIINADDKKETFSLLTHWLEVYCHTLQQVQVNKRLSPQASEELSGDGPVSYSSMDSSFSQDSAGTSCDSLHWDCNDIGFEPSAMSADILEQITEMFIQCLQAGVYTVGLHNPKVISDRYKQDLQHPVTPEEVKKRDSFYAQLIACDCGLLQYSHMLNALDTLGCNYYILTWVALLEKITKDIDIIQSHTLPDIIPDLDFTRSQRLLFLYKIASAGSMKKLVTAASLIVDPIVIQDFIFLLSYLAPSSEVDGTNVRSHIPKLLLQYLNQHSQIKSLMQSYLDSWKLCAELQYDILSALLCEVESSVYSCECGMPQPGERPIAIEALAHTLLTHQLINPCRMASLCQTAGFWEGFCTIMLHYNLQSDQENFPYVLQLCDLQLLEDFIETAHPDQYPGLLGTLTRVTCSDPSIMRCFRCQSVLQLLSNSNESKTSVNVGLPPSHPTLENCIEKVLADDCCEEEKEDNLSGWKGGGQGGVHSMRQVWEAVVWQLLRLCGAAHTLSILTEVQDDIPPGILTNKVYQWCILVSLAERRGEGARLALLHSLTNASPRLYSLKVGKCLYKQEIREHPEHIEDRENAQNAPHTLITDSTAVHSVKGSTSTHDLISTSLTHRTTNSSPQPQKELFHTPTTPGHHWGVAAGLLSGLCHCCHLPLTTAALVSEGGITVFPCTHAFHTVCLSHCGHHCVTCTKENQRVGSQFRNDLTL